MFKHNLGFYSLPFIFTTVCMLSACQPKQTHDYFTGYVEAELIYIAAPQSGWLTQQALQAGKELQVGDLAFQLDDEQQQAQVQEAMARLIQAQAEERNSQQGARVQELDELYAQRKQAKVAVDFAKQEQSRWLNLVEQGLAPAAKATEVESNYASSLANLQAIDASIAVAKLGAREELLASAEAGEQAAQAALSQAQWSLAQRRVQTNVAGMVEEVFYRQGEYVTAGKPVVALMPKDGLIIRFFVPQAELMKVAVGKTVEVSADGSEQTFSATVFHIADSAEFTPPVIYDQENRQKLLFLVEARVQARVQVQGQLTTDVNNANAPRATNLRPGLPVKVHLS
jgi:HlyD family secretion protein